MDATSAIGQQHFMKNIAYVLVKNVYQIINSWFEELWDGHFHLFYYTSVALWKKYWKKSLQPTIHLFSLSPSPSPFCLLSPSL